MNTSQNICCKELALTEFQLKKSISEVDDDELLYYINAGKTRLLLLFINTYNRKSTGDNNKLIRNKKKILGLPLASSQTRQLYNLRFPHREFLDFSL